LLTNGKCKPLQSTEPVKKLISAVCILPENCPEKNGKIAQNLREDCANIDVK